jgi:hypothetical protein
LTGDGAGVEWTGSTWTGSTWTGSAGLGVVDPDEVVELSASLLAARAEVERVLSDARIEIGGGLGASLARWLAAAIASSAAFV